MNRMKASILLKDYIKKNELIAHTEGRLKFVEPNEDLLELLGDPLPLNKKQPERGDGYTMNNMLSFISRFVITNE